VANILREHEAWNPFMDEERIHTAFMCDVLAYDSLTHYERRELFERLYDLHSKGLPHPKFPSNGTNWLREWCRAVEENPSLLSNRINKRQGADTKRLPKKFADGRPITDEIMRAVVTEYRETGMNQKALAKKFGMSHASLGAIINFYEL
jgi:hypothetical protein